MKPNKKIVPILILFLFFGVQTWSQDTRTFKVFQFPANKIPTIDGNADDWKMVPESYVVGMNEL